MADEAAFALAGLIPSRSDILVNGPAAAQVAKVKDMYKRVIYIKADSINILTSIKESLDIYIKNDLSSKGVGVIFDYNPLNFV